MGQFYILISLVATQLQAFVKTHRTDYKKGKILPIKMYFIKSDFQIKSLQLDGRYCDDGRVLNLICVGVT